MNRNRWIALALGGTLVLVVGGYFAYDQFLRGDDVAPLALPSAAASTAPSPSTAAAASGPASGSGEVAGTWTVADGSVAGYRVREKLAGLPAESDAVGRTGDVSGEIVLATAGAGAVVESGRIAVDLTTLTSDEGRRDRRLQESAIETNRFPTTTFTLTEPVEIPASALSGEAVDVTLTGDLDLHGVTKSVAIPVQARLVDGRIEVAGGLTFPFADFGIEPPNIAGFVTVEDEGTLEFLLILEKG